MKYRSKVVEIEAFQWKAGYVAPAWFLDARKNGIAFPDNEGGCGIKTLEGTMRASIGDWIIRGTEGELYPCKPSVFERKYEPTEVQS